MNVLVGVISYAAAWVLPRAFVDDLRRAFPQHTFIDTWDEDGIRRLIPDADIACVPHVDRAMLASAPRLRWIQSPSVGVGGMLYPEMIASPVVITTARGIRAHAIAEHVLGVTIALARQLHVALRHQVAHEWVQDRIEESGAVRTLLGRRMAILGLGSIGLEVARIASAFGLRVSAIRRRADVPRSDGVDEILSPERLGDLLGRSDIVVLSAPVTAATRGLIGRRELAQMKAGAFLVNIGRGQLVDDAALVDALTSKRLGGAALDVFTHEPLDPASPYWDLPNVIITPHISGAMEDYWTPLVALFADNLRRFERGAPLLNVVDKSAGY
jgi:D-2-hydroxyacid dehydrogenase (NADP+)